MSHVDAVDLSDEQLAEAEVAALHTMSAKIDPSDGRMLAATFIDRGSQPSRLLLSISHFVVDAMSWQILLPELLDACRAIASGQPPAPRKEAVDYATWTTILGRSAPTVYTARLLAQWRTYSELLTAHSPQMLCAHHADDPALTLQTIVLAPEVTASLVHRLPNVLGAATSDILLAGLLSAVREEASPPSENDAEWLVLMQGHGRAEAFLTDADLASADLGNTVGLFAESYPALIDTGEAESLNDAVRNVADALGAVPDGGEGYSFARRQLASVLPAPDDCEIAFNYEGRFTASSDDGWILAAEEREVLVSHTERLGGTNQLAAIARVVGATMAVSCSSPNGNLDVRRVAAIVARWAEILTAHAQSVDENEGFQQ